jgi:hypothetical protein
MFRRELTKDNLKKLNIGLDVMNAYKPELFDLAFCYKMTREQIIDNIIKNSVSFEVSCQKYYWIGANSLMNYLLTHTQWFTIRRCKDPLNIYREPDYFISREMFLNFGLLSPYFFELLLTKINEDNLEIIKLKYNDLKDMNKILSKYLYLPLETILPGDVTLKDHIIWVIEAIKNKSDDYNLIIDYFNK